MTAGAGRGVFARGIAAGHAFVRVPPLFMMDCPEDLRGVAFHSVSQFSAALLRGRFLPALDADTARPSPGMPVARLVAGVSHNPLADLHAPAAR
ncbi:hypothetical protein [Burkholderia lata]|uniref:hypothetical protein n=1 Tax=Burkholderia lata (strain ATCC 17760 / DSM 23089 / LMG 22485 / NCIMB 9086 / R18194 / 383) TaxID=482957 RepID=UPI00243030C1|nr:hypothetical protein [Burkholderia lata]